MQHAAACNTVTPHIRPPASHFVNSLSTLVLCRGPAKAWPPAVRKNLRPVGGVYELAGAGWVGGVTTKPTAPEHTYSVAGNGRKGEEREEGKETGSWGSCWRPCQKAVSALLHLLLLLRLRLRLQNKELPRVGICFLVEGVCFPPVGVCCCNCNNTIIVTVQS